MQALRLSFSKAANTYDIKGKIQKKVAKEVLNKIKDKHFSTIVEIGSGTGFLSIPLSKRLIFDRFIHVDITYNFLKKLKGNLTGKHFFINSYAENIPLRDGIADLLISSATIHWLSNPEKTLPLILKTLKKGGDFYFSIFTSNSLTELKEVSEISGFGSVFPMKTPDFYISLLGKEAKVLSFEVKNYREKFANPLDLLLTHKLTGTNYSQKKALSGKEAFKRFCHIYRERFGNHEGIYATYEVLFIQGQK